VKPLERWTDWSVASETIHGIALLELQDHGIEAKEAARRINEVCAGRQVLSDNPQMDSDWLHQLYHDVGVTMEFTVHDSRQLEALAVTLGRLPGNFAQGLLEQVKERFPHPHRAGPDARRECARFLALSLPERMDAILALA
jgi:hypothetical protein